MGEAGHHRFASPTGASRVGLDDILLLCFLDADPSEAWPAVRALADTVAASGQGAVSYASPFLPTIVGTDTYTDQLW